MFLVTCGRPVFGCRLLLSSNAACPIRDANWLVLFASPYLCQREKALAEEALKNPVAPV